MPRPLPTSSVIFGCVMSAVASAVTVMFMLETDAWIEGETGHALAGGVLLFTFVVALFHALAFGFPLYAALSKHWRLNLWRALAGGFFVGCLPYTAYGVPTLLEDASAWSSILPWSAGLGAVGMVGGAAFWASVKPRLAGMR